MRGPRGMPRDPQQYQPAPAAPEVNMQASPTTAGVPAALEEHLRAATPAKAAYYDQPPPPGRSMPGLAAASGVAATAAFAFPDETLTSVAEFSRASKTTGSSTSLKVALVESALDSSTGEKMEEGTTSAGGAVGAPVLSTTGKQEASAPGTAGAEQGQTSSSFSTFPLSSKGFSEPENSASTEVRVEEEVEMPSLPCPPPARRGRHKRRSRSRRGGESRDRGRRRYDFVVAFVICEDVIVVFTS